MPGADPKPVGRVVVDSLVTTRACLRWRWCACCEEPSSNGHHVLAKTDGGDDVLANIVPLCGTGTTGCHGLVENEDAEALRKLGEWIREYRPDTVAYLRSKLRDADDWMERRLGVRPYPQDL